MPGPDGRSIAVDVPDHVVALVGFQEGLVITLEVTADERPDAHSFWLHGSEATLRADFDRHRLELIPVGGRPRAVRVARGERRRWTVEADYVAAIREGRPITLDDYSTAWHGMAFTDALHRSAATGRRVEISDAP
jgi:predicted dehydrogenase